MPRAPLGTRVARQATRRRAISAISAVLSLALVAGAVAVVAFVVLRTPPSIESAARLAPEGTAIAAPALSELPRETAPARTRQIPAEPAAPAIAALPTVAAQPETAGPTPTPRVVSLPVAAPSSTSSPPERFVPSETAAVPVVALAPVSSAPVSDAGPTTAAPPTATDPPADGSAEGIVGLAASDDDPAATLRERLDSRADDAPAAEAMRRALALRDGSGRDRERGEAGVRTAPLFAGRDGMEDPPLVAPAPDGDVALPAPAIPVVSGSSDPFPVSGPDANAMIDEIADRVRQPRD